MDKKLIFLVLIFFVSFLSFTSLALRRTPLSTLTRAAEEKEPSIKNSVIFVWPLLVKIKEKTPVKITVFVRNNKNLPLANKKVTLTTSLGQIKQNNIISDKNGKAEFILENDTPGEAIIEAIIDNNFKLLNKTSVKFE